MFSQFTQLRQAVESLAQHSPKPSQDLSADEQGPRSSTDSQGLRASISSSQLAESALTNLKKTLASQRSASPGADASRVASPTAEGSARPPTHRTTLEDRLRAKFALGDVSNSTTSTSSRTSPTPISVTDHPLSPTSIPQPAASAPRAPVPQTPTSQTPVFQTSAFQTPVVEPSVAGIDHTETVAPPADQVAAVLSPTSAPLPESPALSPELEASSFLTLDLPQVSSPHASSLSEKTTISPSASPASVEDIPRPEIALSSSVPSEAGPGVQNIENGDAEVSADDSPTEEITSVDEVKASQSSQTILHETTPAPSHPAEDGMPSDDLVSPVQAASHAKTVEVGLTLKAEDFSSEAQPSPYPLLTESGASSQPNGHVPDAAVTASPVEDSKSKGGIIPTEAPLAESPGHPDIDDLQKRLKLVEQRFADVSTSFKRLQAEKLAADKVIQEFTPLETVQEVDALRDYLQNMNLKNEMSQDEIRRLTGKLTRQDERIEELRDIHRLESKSRSDQIDKLRAQVDEAEALLKVSQSSTTQVEEQVTKREAEIEHLGGELERAKASAKEEEEKRVKAITLLKTVRQKLVKAEKDRDDVQKEFQTFKEKEKAEREKDQAEKLELRGEIDKVNAERDIAVAGLRVQFDKEVAALKDKHDKEIAMLRGQYELEAITTKTSLKREIDGKSSRISDLESSVQVLSSEKDELFDQLQLRQAELESSRSHLESLEGQSTELQYQLREANDRIALLNEELADARREQEPRYQGSGPSAEEVTRMLSAAEAKYEYRISDLRSRLTTVERERDEGEAEWSRKLSEKVNELEVLRGTLTSSARSREEESESVNALKGEVVVLKEEVRSHQKRIVDLRIQAEKVAEVESVFQTQLSELGARAAALQQHVEDDKAREAQLRAHNKTLREELRKVQSLAALLERQRNPGVGYWASRQENATEAHSPRSSVSDLPRDTPSRPGTPSTVQSEEEVNFEYLRNVILQFLEHKEMRPHLVRILSTILRFTPQETRRLISKV